MSADAFRNDRVLVAIDGSAATAAVEIAAGHAQARGGVLDVVHVVESPLFPHRHGPDPLPAAVAAARAAAPEIVVRSIARTGTPVSVLTDLARDCALVVLGSRGHGAVADASLGSVAISLLGTAQCPVLVVRPRAERVRSAGPVVAALSGDADEDEPVLEFAFDEAGRRDISLVAAHGRPRPAPSVLGLLLAVTGVGRSPDGSEDIARELAPWRARHPAVPVRIAVRRVRPAAAVLDAARGAGLLIVGSRGRGPGTGLLLGSVSQTALHHARCPVAVVPATLR